MEWDWEDAPTLRERWLKVGVTQTNAQA
jgi:hypothetical protein